MTDDITIDDHITIKDRGDDRRVPDSGMSLYVKDGKLHGVDSDGTYSLPINSVHTESLDNVHEHIVSDSQELADAFDDAEQNAGVSIYLADNTIFEPFAHRAAPVKPLHGFSIEGHFPGDDMFTYDGVRLTDADDPSGSVIEAQNNVLFEVNNSTGMRFENFGVRNFQHVLKSGYGGTGADARGLSQSVFRNIALWENTDYAFKLYNIQRVNMDTIIGGHVDSLIHVIAEHDTLQPGNCVWRDILCAPDSSESVDGHSIYLEGRNVALNYITMLRPQCITPVTNTYDAIRIEGDTQTTEAPSQNHTLLGVDTEGEYKNHVHVTGNGRRNYIQYSGNQSATNYDVRLDGFANELHCMDKANVESTEGNNFVFGRVLSMDGSVGTGFVKDVNDSSDLKIFANSQGRPMRWFADYIEYKDLIQNALGFASQQRGAPSTANLPSGQTMVYASDGTDAGSAGDLMYAVNDAGTIKTSVLAQVSNAT